MTTLFGSPATVKTGCDRADRADFGVHPMTLWKWLRQADIDDGAASGKSTGESAELRELRRRNRLLEQENEVLRRAAAYLSQSNLPGKGFTRS